MIRNNFCWHVVAHESIEMKATGPSHSCVCVCVWLEGIIKDHNLFSICSPLLNASSLSRAEGVQIIYFR